MSLSAYRTYKDSGISWVGDIPAHWSSPPLVGVAIERSESNVGMRDNNLLSLSYGRIVRKDADSNDGLLPESFETYQIVHKGDIVLRLTDLQNDKRSLRSAIACERGIITSAYLALKPTTVDSIFLSYLLRAYDLTKVFYSMGGGLRQSMKFSDLKRMPILMPPEDEQIAIASFLDRETAKIDALIAKQKKLLTLLAEKRQAAISHAVTRGINPNAPIKDSGIPWLGQVPGHWEVRALKTIVSIPITDGPHETPEFLDEGVLFVSAEAVGTGSIDFEKVRGCISVEDNARYSLKYKPKLHDIYMVKSGATTGITAMVEGRTDFNIWSPLAAIRCNTMVANPHYILSYLRSKNFQEAVALNWSFGTQQNIGMGVLGDLAVALPPVDEQNLIARYLNSTLGALPLLQNEAERAIFLLKERCSALISAAVTGKIDVRGLTATSEAA